MGGGLLVRGMLSGVEGKRELQLITPIIELLAFVKYVSGCQLLKLTFDITPMDREVDFP